MIQIAHLSDLHFGRHSDRLARILADTLTARAPDLIVLSGDLTQHARESEFAAAARFLASLPRPLLVVPGNHDLPGWRPWRRFINPWQMWRRHIGRELEPRVAGDGFVAIGVQTARRWGLHLDWSRGRMNQRQIERVKCLAQEAQPEDVRILVAHHPFLLSAEMRRRGLIGRASGALPQLKAARVDLILGGHLHKSNAGVAAGVVVAQAGTAISTRLKTEANALNWIQASTHSIGIMPWCWDGLAFRPTASWHFRREPSGWQAGWHAGNGDEWRFTPARQSD